MRRLRRIERSSHCVAWRRRQDAVSVEPGEGGITAPSRPTRSPSCRAADSCGQLAQTSGGSSTGTRATVHGAAERATGGGGGRVRTAGAKRQPGWLPPGWSTSAEPEPAQTP